MEQATHTPFEQWLCDKLVAKRYGVGRVTPWRWAREGDFPQPVKLGGKCTRWRLSDLEAWEVAQ